MAILQSTTVTGSLIVSGSTDNLVQVIGSGSTLFSVNGASGQLFGIADDLTDSLFSVNTIAGLPVIEAFADNTVKIGTFGSEELIVSESQVSILSASLSGPTLFLDGNVGIGETDPSGYWGQAHNLVLTDSNTGLTIKSGTSGNGRIVFTDTKSSTAGLSDGGMIHYDHIGDSMRLHANGSEAMRIDSSGNVGIDTISPGFKLQVATPQETTDPISFAFDITRENSTGRGMTFGMSADDSYGAIGTHNADLQLGHTFGTEAGGQPAFYPTLTVQHIDEAVGNVGIGTTSPQAPLHVIAAGSSNNALIQEWSYTAGTIDQYSLMLKQTVTSGVVRYNFSMVNNNTAYNDVLVLDRGNVGIGTTTPSQKLTVAGTISGSSDLSIDGNSIFDGTVGYNTFNSGFGGNGWRIDNSANAEFQNLTVRGTFSVYELLAQQVRATNGSLLVATSGKVDDISGTTLFFDTGSRYGHGFRDGDILLAQRLDPEGTSLKRTFITVDSISSTGSLVYTDLSGNTPEIGQEFVRIGNTSDVDRQGHIYLTADDSNAPYIGVRDGLSGSVQFTSGTGSIEKVRVGRLDGITSSTFGSLSGYGFFAKGNAYLEGGISATFGDIGGFGITQTAISSSNDNLILRDNGQITGSSVLFDGGKIAGFSVSGNSLHLDEGAVEVGLGTADQLSWSSAVVGLQAGEDADNRIFLGEVQGLYEFRVLTGGNSPVILGSRDNRISSWSLATTEIQGGTVSGGGDGSYTTSGIRLGADGYISAPKFYLSSGGDANFKGTVTIGSTDLDESNTLNTEDFTTGNINHNANFTLVAPDGRPSGWYAAYSNTSAGIVSYVDSNKTALKLYSASDVTIGVAGRAFQVDPTVEYTIKFRVKSNNATSAGFYFRIQELDSNLSEGDKFISHNSGNSETGAVEDTRQVTQASSVNPLVEASSKDIDNGPITTSYVDYEVLYTPTSTAKYASPLYLNWTGMSTNELHIDLCEIIINTADKKRGTVGGWTIQTDKIFSGTDEDVTGFTTSAGNLILSSSGAIHAKEFYVDKAGNAEFKGTLTAPGGNIGGFTISGDALAGSNFYISGSATGNEFFISSSNFNVKANGDVTGSSVLFTGGRIGDEYQNITFDPTGNITLNNVELKVSDTTGLRTDIYDGANSKRVVLDDDTIYYTTFEDDTLITIIGTDGAIKSTITVDTKYTEGTISAADIAVGDIIDTDKPVSLVNTGGGHAVLPFSFLSKTFLLYVNRYQTRTIRVFSPFGDATVSASFDGSNDGTFNDGVAATVAPQNTATDINASDIISGTWPTSGDDYFKIESDLPIVAFNDGPTGDYVSLYPLSKEILHADEGVPINLNSTTSTTHQGGGYYTSNTPFQVQRIGDGGGGDSDQGMPVQALGDTYIIPHSVGGYEILSIEPNIIKVYTLTTGTKTLDNTVDHSAASKTNPINTLVGSDSAGGTSVHTGAMLFEGTAPFALRTQDPEDDEYHVIGYRRTQREIYDNSTTIKGDRIRTGKIQSNNWNNSTAGSLIDLDSGTAHLGGSGSNAAFYFDGTDLFLTGSINATSGNFTGTISAGDGDIAGWTIEPGYIRKEFDASSRISLASVRTDGYDPIGLSLYRDDGDLDSSTDSVKIMRFGQISDKGTYNVWGDNAYGLQIWKGSATLGGEILRFDSASALIGGFEIDTDEISDVGNNLRLKANGQITASAALIGGTSTIAGFTVSDTQLAASSGILNLKANGRITGSAVSFTGGRIAGFDFTSTAFQSRQFDSSGRRAFQLYTGFSTTEEYISGSGDTSVGGSSIDAYGIYNDPYNYWQRYSQDFQSGDAQYFRVGDSTEWIFWNDTTFDINLDGATLGTLTLDNLSDQGSELTALTINGSNAVGYSELGSNAFTSTNIAVSSYTNATDNRVLTSTGAGGINGEANLTFNGSRLFVSGDVGIGAADGSSKLTIRNSTGGSESWTGGIRVENTSTTTGEAAVAFSNAGASGTGANQWIIGVNQSANFDIAYGTLFTNGNTAIRVGTNKNVGIGGVFTSARLDLVQSADTAGGGIRIRESDDNNDYWDIFLGGGDSLFFYYTGTTNGGFISDTVGPTQMNFTGQHRSNISSIYDNITEITGSKRVGLIVSADGTYSNLDGGTEPTINDSIPNITLSTTAKDKRVFGVISDEEDLSDGIRTFSQGNFVSTYEVSGSEIGRTFVNSIGEGGIWVSNYSGSLENGDYITTSPIPGLGMKQDDDLLHNYTVAKITQDCYFNDNTKYIELEFSGSIYRKQFVGCTYHCG